ncbi:cation diffusion facilitator family transporter [Catenibacillus scindens]|uniref:Cation diffusion facilitator family transporter n=1 Tax=Catenibacillus scindens TaxID=673271 RepID=A0A7W8HC80_9FIRM|nr:cation diffusion facilitator family transporter [Catenibacillus scindens]MBB5265635.1 cation diffusion facilitator family transporter [Catenibacillus scindens]
MTNILVRLFVKNYNDTENDQVRTAYGVLASIVGILCNILLFAVKVAIGTLVGSIAVVADAFNNLSDAFSSIISFVGVKLASRPADQEHPFGHGRYEYIAAFIVACLVIEVGFTFIQSSFDKILHPEAVTFSIVSVIILCLSILVKLWLGLFNRKLGKKINSTVMMATSADALGDVLTTLATIVSLLIYGILGWNVDGIVGMVVAIVVVFAGINIAKDTIRPLLGERPDPKVYKMLEKKVESYEGIVGTHDLIIHNYGPTKSMATIHAEVSNKEDIETSHELIDKIEREVTKETGIFLVIHMDPVDVEDPFVIQWRKRVYDMIHEMDPNVSAHDFRMVKGKEQINLIFDIVVPYSYDLEKTHQFTIRLEERIKRMDSRCQCVITIDHSFGDE